MFAVIPFNGTWIALQKCQHPEVHSGDSQSIHSLNGDEVSLTCFTSQPEDEYLDNVSHSLPLLTYCADSRETCVPAKAVRSQACDKALDYFIYLTSTAIYCHYSLPRRQPQTRHSLIQGSCLKRAGTGGRGVFWSSVLSQWM